MYSSDSEWNPTEVDSNSDLDNVDVFLSRNLKRGIGSLFDPCVNAMGRQPYWPSHMEVSYCTFGFGANIQRDLRILLLPRDSPHDNLSGVLDLSARGKGNSCLTKLFGGLSYEKNPEVQ